MTNLPPETPDEESEWAQERAERDAETDRAERRTEERAEKVAEKVEEAVHAQTERIEKRAEDLAEHQAEQRIGYRVEERADQRADVQGELVGITDAIQTLIDHMDQSLPEERVQKVLEAALAEERRSRQRFLWTILSPILVTIIVAGGAWWQSKANGDTLTEAKTTADYVRHCLQHKTDGLTPVQITDECGDPSAGSIFFVTYLNCVFPLPIAERTESKMNGCVTKAVTAQTQATATTTTTR